MLYTATVLDTDEHPPSHGRSAKYDEARVFGTFHFEAPAFRRFGRNHRVPEALIETATTVAQQYLPDASYDRTVLVEISAFWPKRVGYGERGDTAWTQTSTLTAFLVSTEHLRRRDEGSLKRLAVIG
jgi:hypothetical protein